MTEEEKGQLKQLGSKIKAIRNQRGLTLRELGFRVDKEPQSLSRLEQGQINPSYLYLRTICVGLEIELSDLLSTNLP